MKLNFALGLVLSMAATSAFAQVTPTGLSNPDVYKDKAALKSWENGETRMPPKPSDMWEVGVHGGFFGYSSDVPLQPGFGFGAHVRKALGYVFSLRLDLMRGQAYGKSYKALSAGSALTQTGANPVLNAIGYTPANPYFLSYSSEYYQASLQGVVQVGNLLFHKPDNRWAVYGFAGLGVSAYSTKYDAKAGNNIYSFPSSKLNQDATNFAGRDERYRVLNSIWDGTYETQANSKSSDIDGLFNRKKDNFTSNIVFPIGAGVSYRLSKRVNISLEEQVILLDDDLLDGQDRAYEGSFTQNRDVPHYANLRLSFNIGSDKNKVEPLYWKNPLDMPYAQLQKVNKRPSAEDMMKDDDNDGVVNMLDKELDTPAGAPVDTRGRALDSDGDGVKDVADKEPFTAPGMPVDKDGIGTGLIKNIDCSVCGGGSWFLPSVHFDNDSYCIKGEYYGDLKNVASVLAKNPKVCVAVKGFTDDGRTGDYNNGLAYNRAKAVADFLASNFGVDRNRIAVKVGGNEAITKTGTSVNSANRRVEIETTACGTASDSAPASAVSSGTSSCYSAPVNTGGPYVSQPVQAEPIKIKISNPKR